MTYYSEYVLFKIEQSNIHDVVLAIIEALSTVSAKVSARYKEQINVKFTRKINLCVRSAFTSLHNLDGPDFA